LDESLEKINYNSEKRILRTAVLNNFCDSIYELIKIVSIDISILFNFIEN
jgi:hypothetical protein